MQKKETAIEVKVGALVLFATALLVAMVMVLGDFSFSDGPEFYVQFDNAGGLKPGADVAISGINVGTVSRLEFAKNDPDPDQNLSAVAVQATLKVKPDFIEAIRVDSQFYITTRGILGEPYIEIVSKTFDAPAVAPGQVLRGIDPPRMEIIIARASELLELVIELIDDPDIHVKDLIANTAAFMKTYDNLVGENRDNIDATLDGVRISAEEASKLLAALNVGVGDGDELRATLSDFRSTSASARRVAARVDGKLDPLIDDLSVSAQNARRLTDSAERIITNNEDKIVATLENVQTSSESLVTLSADAEKMLASVQAGEGTIGALLAEREVYEDLKEMMRIIKQQPWKILWKE